MVDQSDLPFRMTAVKYGATATWTYVYAADVIQMYHADDVLYDVDVYEKARRALEVGRHAPDNRDIVTGGHAPQIVQLAGDDPARLADAARRFLPWADGIDINFGCPQTRAQRGHYGGYLLGRRDWDTTEQIVHVLAHSCDVPISAKLRLCDTATDTYELGARLARAGAHILTLHARHVAPNRRRAGAAKLEHVAGLVDALHAHGLHASQPAGHTHVLTNGNVRAQEDIPANLAFTRADGIMIGEPLLLHPDLFAKTAPGACTAAPLHTYLSLCTRYDDASMPCVQQHVQYMIRGMPPGRETRALHDALRTAPDPASMLATLTRRALPPG